MSGLIQPYMFAAAGGGGTGPAAWLSAVTGNGAWGAWGFAETSGTSLADGSGNSRPLTTTGSPTLAQTGPDGTANAISWPNATASAQSSATATTSPATWSTFIKLTANPAASTSIVTFDAGAGTFDKTLYIDTSGILHFYVYDGAGEVCNAASALTLNTWHHVAASVGAAGLKIRLDKTTVASVGFVTSSYAGAAMKASIRNAPGTPNGLGAVTGTGPILIGPTAVFTSQLTDTQTDAHKDTLL